MSRSRYTEGTAGRAVGLLIPARLTISGGADRFLDTECAGLEPLTNLPCGVAGAARDGLLPLAIPRTHFRPGSSLAGRHLSDGPRQSCHATCEGDARAVAFFYPLNDAPHDDAKLFHKPVHLRAFAFIEVFKA